MSAIAAPWFMLMAEQQAEFVGYFFWKHHVVRYVNSFNHAQPWWFYGPMMALGMMPVTLLFPAVGVHLAQRDEATCRLRTPAMGAMLLAAAWILAFFTVSSCKLVTYTLPTFPLLTLACGKVLDDIFLATDRVNDWLQALARRTVWFATGAMNWVIIGGLVFVVILSPRTPVVLGGFALFAVITLSLLYTNSLNSRQRLLAAALGSYGLVAVLGFGFVVPEFAEWRSVNHSAAQIQATLGNDVPVVFFGRRSQAATFEIPAGVVEFSATQTDDFEVYMAEHPVVVVVTGRQDVPKLREKCSDTVTLDGPRARSRVYVATRRAVEAKQLEPSSTLRK